MRYPSQIFGALVTEKVRSLGAMLVNVDGEAFMHPLETRDVAAASIIRECTDRHKGVTTPLGTGVWLDTPMIERIGGEGTIEKRIPAMLRMYMNYDIDMRKLADPRLPRRCTTRTAASRSVGTASRRSSATCWLRARPSAASTAATA